MPRPLLPLAAVIVGSFCLHAAEPDPVERALAVQHALATAERHLTANAPAEAVAVLEAQLPNADGSRAFLDALRRGYTAELTHLETVPSADPARVLQLRRKLGLLGGTGAVADAPAVSPEPAAPAADPLGDARALFQLGKHAEAAAAFAVLHDRSPLSPDEVAVWAFCRVRVAADTVNQPACDAGAAAAAEKDVVAALKLAPNNAELQKVGRVVLVVSRQKANGPRAAATAPAADPLPAGDWLTSETPSFRVRYRPEDRETGEAVAKAVEAKRNETFARWSGAPTGAWAPRCEITVHSTAEAYTQGTGKAAGNTGHATVKLTDGRAIERRIDLRADDAGAVANTLPRELTHVVLADHFPYTPPPKWAEEGMAVLAGSPDEVSRFVRTLPRCAGELFPVATLMEMKDIPAADRVTGFYCESVTLVDYLVKLKGERHFTLFLRDAQRYGSAKALSQQYGIASPQALEQAWKRASLDVARGQAP